MVKVLVIFILFVVFLSYSIILVSEQMQHDSSCIEAFSAPAASFMESIQPTICQSNQKMHYTVENDTYRLRCYSECSASNSNVAVPVNNCKLLTQSNCEVIITDKCYLDQDFLEATSNANISCDISGYTECKNCIESNVTECESVSNVCQKEISYTIPQGFSKCLLSPSVNGVSSLEIASSFIIPCEDEQCINSVTNGGLGDVNLVTDNSTINSYSGISPNTTSEYSKGDTDITLVNAEDFYEGDLILIIQMQGIDTYGQWELKRIENKSDNTVSLDSELLYTYTYKDEQTAERYQVVKIPQYDTLTVESKLSSKMYNGVTGGVFAVAANELIINEGGIISMTGKGYRGAFNLRPGHNNWPTRQEEPGANGSVGEGYAGKYIANWMLFSHNSSSQHKMYSNSTNYGGGAGGNGGTLGKAWEGVTSGQGGNHNHASSDKNVKLTMGGGGGGGGTHDTDGKVEAGHGGGVILLIANNITFDGGSIESNGGNAKDTNGSWHGAHGGGAGGSVHIFADTITQRKNAQIEVSGGIGGKSTHQNKGLTGGSGSSGVINISTKTPTDLPLTEGNYKFKETVTEHQFHS